MSVISFAATLLLLVACDGKSVAPDASGPVPGTVSEVAVVTTVVQAPEGSRTERHSITAHDIASVQADMTATSAHFTAGNGAQLAAAGRGQRKYSLPDGSTAKVDRELTADGATTRITMSSPSGRTIVAELHWSTVDGERRLVSQSFRAFDLGVAVGSLSVAPAAGSTDISSAFGDDPSASTTGGNGPQLTTAIGACAAEIQAAQDAILYYWSVCAAVGISALGGPLAFGAAGIALIYAAHMVDVTEQQLDNCIAGI